MGCESVHSLVVAVEVGYSDLVRPLLEDPTHTPDIVTTGFETAIKTGDEGLIRMLLASRATSAIDLHVAALSGRPSSSNCFTRRRTI